MPFRPSGNALFTARYYTGNKGVNALDPDGLKAIPPLARALNLTTFKKLSNLILAGICLFCSLLCKQSFYPLLPLFALFLFLEKENRWRKTAWFFGAFLLCTALFFNYLHQKNILSAFLQMTSGAASSGQALQHGLLDYFRITPELALPSILLLFPVAWWFRKGKYPKIALAAWSLWLFSLVASYAAITWLRQEHTVPFAQSRAMFWVAVIWTGFTGWTGLRGVLPRKEGRVNPVHPVNPVKKPPVPPLEAVGRVGPAFLLLGISWCASVSWGYNLPILFATPWVWAGMEITCVLSSAVKPIRFLKPYRFLLLLALLLSFRVGHEFVYRDGRRNEMQESMGAIFPPLSGIYSDAGTAELYRDLKQLAEHYGPNFKTLPAFPQANFLAKTHPPLPLDWVVNRETNGDNTMIIKNLNEKQPVIFVQKSFQDKIDQDPELEVTRQIMQRGKIIEETDHFWVIGNYTLLR